MNFVLAATLQNRKLLYHYLKTLPLKKLNHIPKGFNNNIVWNIGHIVSTQQGLVLGLSGCPLVVDSNFVAMYKKGTKPERDVTQKEIEELKKIVFLTIEQTIESHKKGKLANFKAYDLSAVKMTLNSAEDAMQFNLYHEGLHLGTIMSLLKAK